MTVEIFAGAAPALLHPGGAAALRHRFAAHEILHRVVKTVRREEPAGMGRALHDRQGDIGAARFQRRDMTARALERLAANSTLCSARRHLL